MTERTLVLIKPDGVSRGLCAEIIQRFEKKGFRIAGLKMLRFSADLARRHYRDHVNRDFYPALENFITSGPSVAMVIEGEDAVQVVRAMMGSTSHKDAAPGTIRGDLALSTRENLVHGSDTAESAQREISLFFAPEEIFE